jgi:hypothetical protein
LRVHCSQAVTLAEHLLAPVNNRKKGDMGKKIKPALLAVIVTAVLFAGTVSARQLHKSAGLIGVCSGRCSATQPCSGACSCVHINGASLGSCVSDPP